MRLMELMHTRYSASSPTRTIYDHRHTQRKRLAARYPGSKWEGVQKHRAIHSATVQALALHMSADIPHGQQHQVVQVREPR